MKLFFYIKVIDILLGWLHEVGAIIKKEKNMRLEIVKEGFYNIQMNQ